MNMKLGQIPNLKRLLRSLILAEIILSLILISLNRFLDLETLYAQTQLASIIEINLFSVILVVSLEVFVIMIILVRYLKTSGLEAPPQNTADIIQQTENQKLEYKQTLRWDTRENKINKALEKAVLKTIAAFANNGGGHLVIGITDSGEVTGLASDYQTLKKKSADGFEILLTQLIREHLGVNARQCCRIQIDSYQSKDVCLVAVTPSSSPIYYKEGQSEEFFIRTGNNSSSLTISQANQYIASHPAFIKR